MKIALCQMNIEWENKQSNYRKAEIFLKEAAGQGADLICFPEMSFTGFSMNTKLTAEKKEETVTVMKKMSSDYGIAAAFGWAACAGEKAENHYTVVKGDAVLGDYIKIHPFSYSGEDQRFTGGSRICTINLCGHMIGLSVCYDLRFPELYQRLADEADVILVAANWPEKRRIHWNCLLQARAIETQCFVAGINCTGEIGGLTYSGDSALYGPDGRPYCMCPSEEMMCICEIGNESARFREDFPVRQDRKPEFYRTFYESSADGSVH